MIAIIARWLFPRGGKEHPFADAIQENTNAYRELTASFLKLANNPGIRGIANMSDNSATATLHGSLSVSGWQSAAERRNAQPDDNDLTGDQDGNAVRLEGKNGEAFPGREGAEVPNLSVTRVSNPAKVRSEPSNTASNQSQLARPRGRR